MNPKEFIKNYLDYREKKVIADSYGCRKYETIIFRQGRLFEIRQMQKELNKKNCFKLTKLQEVIKNG